MGLAPFAAPVFGLLPEMMSRFARQAEEGRYPGDRSAAAGLQHITRAAEEHRIDTGPLAASAAVVQRALAAGHGADGPSRLVETLAAPIPSGEVSGR